MNPTPTDPFIPLAGASHQPGGTTEYTANVVSQPATLHAFKPLSGDAPDPATRTEPHKTKACDPRVSIQREGEHVSGIRIHCGCGQVIDLVCVY